MAPTQSSPVPPPGSRVRLGDAGWLISYGIRGLMKLVRARLAFARFEVRDIVLRNNHVKEVIDHHTNSADPAHVARIAYVIPRISARLPWRSDCVIQTMAAQDWLAEHGQMSEIRIGVERTADGEFGAHAWLLHDGKIVTGGNVDRYEILLGAPGSGAQDV